MTSREHYADSQARLQQDRSGRAPVVMPPQATTAPILERVEPKVTTDSGDAEPRADQGA